MRNKKMNRRSDSFLYLRRRNKNTQIMHLRALILPHYPGAQERNDGGPPEKFFRFAKISASNGHLKPIFFLPVFHRWSTFHFCHGSLLSPAPHVLTVHHFGIYFHANLLLRNHLPSDETFLRDISRDQVLNLANGISCLSPPWWKWRIKMTLVWN